MYSYSNSKKEEFPTNKTATISLRFLKKNIKPETNTFCSYSLSVLATFFHFSFFSFRISFFLSHSCFFFVFFSSSPQTTVRFFTQNKPYPIASHTHSFPSIYIYYPTLPLPSDHSNKNNKYKKTKN
jgi:hypothetical protein